MQPIDIKKILPLHLFSDSLKPHIRIVGGAIRNFLLNEPFHDIDLASDLLPHEIQAHFHEQGIKTLDIGIAYGTVTALLGGHPYEITSLREDIQTNGRHAVVSYTTSWEKDALRRDFTMNALYLDMEGQLYDYVGGVADLETRTIRFIGTPLDRIKEDYLRILRFFRFHAWYGADLYDTPSLEGCIQGKEGLQFLSKERITSEFLRTLEAPHAPRVLKTLQNHEILPHILPFSFHLEDLETLYQHNPPSLLKSLLLLLIHNQATAKDLIPFLRLHRKMTESLDRMLSFYETLCKTHALPWVQSPEDQHLLLETLEVCQTILPHQRPLWNEWYAFTQQHSLIFPLKGKDFLQAGYAAGHHLGLLTQEGKLFWQSTHFKASPEEILSYLQSRFPPSA